MFWKRFSQTRSANKLFNEATKHWVKMRSYFFVDERKVCSELADVVRLCQLSIEADEKSGNAYVLLANALTVAASHGSGRSDQERYEFLQSRAAAVIHFWYTLPHRGYPITKANNTAIGERLWRIMVDDISQVKSLSKDAAIALLESYRDSIASETISPDSLEKIQGVILGTSSTPGPDRREFRGPLEETLPPEIWNFLVEIAGKRVNEELDVGQVITDQSSQFRLVSDKLDKLEDLLDSRRFDASVQLIERITQAYKDKDFRQAIGWLTWLFILGEHRDRITPDSDSEDKAKLWKVRAEGLRMTISAAHQAKDWNTLLLAVGFCEWAGLSAHCDKILRVVYNQIGKQAVDSRLRDLELQPRMIAESLLVNRLRRHLGKS